MEDDEKTAPSDLYQQIKKQYEMINNKGILDQIVAKKSSMVIDHSSHDDYSWGVSTHHINDKLKSDPAKDHLRLRNKQLETQKDLAENLLHDLTDGNEALQRSLIQLDPENIRYIKKPYVTIQMEAITADPESYHCINNAAQEVIDAYRIIK